MFFLFFSYFYSILPDKMQTSFQSFFESCISADHSDLSLKSCIEFIANHSFKADVSMSESPIARSHGPSAAEPVVVLLLIDEIAKSQSEDEILKLVGGILDQSPRLVDGRQCWVLPVITSLSGTRLKGLLTGSQRAILPVPLPVPLKSAPAAMKQILQLPAELDPLIDVLCGDVGYHGRMLEAIVDLLHSSKKPQLRTDVIANSHEPFRCLPEVYRLLYDHKCGEAFFRHIVEEPRELIDAVCVALMGLSVPRKAKVLPAGYRGTSTNIAIGQLPATEWTYDHLLSQGVFIGDAGTSSNEITPVMSPLQLVKWAHLMSALPRGSFKKTPQMNLFLLAVTRAFSSSDHNDWKTFEKFHHSMCH